MMPTQIMGVMSTPPRGGMSLRVGARKGSVGMAIRIQGNLVSSIWGYQVRIIRKMKDRVIMTKRGPMIQLAIATDVIMSKNLSFVTALLTPLYFNPGPLRWLLPLSP